MSSEAKFRTVLPNNSISSVVDFTGESSVYQNKLNTSGQAEFVFDSNEITMSLNTIALGTRATIQIPPSYRLIKQCILELEISGQTTSHFVAANMIREFGYRVPGCERMYLSGEQIIVHQAMECETMEKRMKYSEMLGHKSVYSTGTTWEAIATNKRKVYLVLPMPWSSLSGRHAAKPYPAHLTTQPLELDILFNDMSAFGGTSIAIGSGKILFVYSSLPNLNLYKNTVYKYNFSAPYGINYSVTNKRLESFDAQGKVGIAGAHHSFIMTGLRNGEVTQFSFIVRPTNALSPANTLGLGKRVYNIKLTYAGQTIWNGEDISSELFSLFYDELPSIMPASVDWRQIDGQSFVTGHKLVGNKQLHLPMDNSHIINIPVGAVFNHMKNSGDYTLGCDFKDTDLRLEFHTDDAADYSVVGVYYLTSIYQFDGQSAKLIQ